MRPAHQRVLFSVVTKATLTKCVAGDIFWRRKVFTLFPVETKPILVTALLLQVALGQNGFAPGEASADKNQHGHNMKTFELPSGSAKGLGAAVGGESCP